MNNKFLKVLVLILIITFVGWLCFFIGIDFSIKTLLLVMTIDYAIGISLAIIGSSKHGDGKLSSKIGYKGLIKKITILLLVGLGAIIIIGSSKHGDGKLSSKIGYKGLIKKITILLLVGLGAIIDDYLVASGISFEYIKDISVVAFIINEIVSIVENSKLAGLEIPDIFTKLIEFLNIKKKK